MAAYLGTTCTTDFLYEFDAISETQSVATLFINDVIGREYGALDDPGA